MYKVLKENRRHAIQNSQPIIVPLILFPTNGIDGSLEGQMN